MRKVENIKCNIEFWRGWNAISFNRGALIPSRPVATFVGSDLINLSKVLVSRRGISKFEVDGFLVFTKFSI